MEEGAYDLIRKNFDTTYDGSGIEGNNRASDNISIFPVPVQDQLNVRTASDSSFAKVNIYSATGQLVVSQTIFASSGAVDVATLIPGYYIVQVQTETESATFRMVKK